MFRLIPQLDATNTVGMYMLTFMKAVIYLSKYVFSNCLSFFVGGKWRHYNVTIKCGYMGSPFSSISTPFYCLFGADGDVLHLGEELSPHGSAAGLDQPSASIGGGILAKHNLSIRELGKT